MTKFIDLLRLKSHAHRSLMTSKADQQVGAFFYRMKEINRSHRATGTPGNTVFDSKKNARHMVSVNHPRCYNTFHALMPALSGKHNGTCAVIRFLCLEQRFIGQLRLNRPAVGIDFLKLSGQDGSFLDIVRKQEVKRKLR